MIPRRMYVLTIVICVGAGVIAVSSVAYSLPGGPIPVVLLAGLVLVTENFAFQLPVAGSVSLSFAAAYAAMVYSGPAAAMVVALAASTNIEEIRSGKPPVLRLYNAGQLSFASGLAAIVYLSAGGHQLALGPSDLGSTLAAAALAAVVFYAANVVLVSLAASTLTGRSPRSLLGELGFLSYGSSLLVLALLGLLIGYLLAVSSWLGLVILVLPFYAARRTFRVYVELTEAYTSTVRSLVAAIEAKDPYTRGHSERVAQYAHMVASRMGVPRVEVDLLERAALLHDVGKIGISLDTLISPDRLTDDELDAIRRHPALGADLVADVEFLRSTVDIIRCHHERCDGKGYPSGMDADSIPALARILAVADSYDAMTSDRAYKPGMSLEQACAELSRVSGTQLDAAVVRSFTEMVRGELMGVTST